MQGPPIKLPNDSTIQTSATGNIPIQHLSPNATKTYLLQDLNKTNLISLGQLCDDGCHILLTKKNLYICKNKELILQGNRNQPDGLWDITLPQQIPVKINVILFKKYQI